MTNQLKGEFFSALKEYIPNKISYLIAVVCVSLSLSIFAFPQKVLELLSLSQTPQSELLLKWLAPPWIMFFGLLLVYILSLRYYRSSKNLTHWIFNEKITLDVGEYRNIKTNSDLLIKISCKKITQDKMPPPCMCIPHSDFLNGFNNVDTEVAIISISPWFVCHGPAVKRLEISPTSNEELFAMGQWQDSEEYSSLYFFNIENNQNGPRFFRCFVNHINPNKQQVELSVFYLWMKKS